MKMNDKSHFRQMKTTSCKFLIRVRKNKVGLTSSLPDKILMTWLAIFTLAPKIKTFFILLFFSKIFIVLNDQSFFVSLPNNDAPVFRFGKECLQFPAGRWL